MYICIYIYIYVNHQQDEERERCQRRLALLFTLMQPLGQPPPATG